MSIVNLDYVLDDELGQIDKSTIAVGDWLVLTDLFTNEEHICVISSIDIKNFTLIKICPTNMGSNPSPIGTYAYNLISIIERDGQVNQLTLKDINRLTRDSGDRSSFIKYIVRKVNVDISVYFSQKEQSIVAGDVDDNIDIDPHGPDVGPNSSGTALKWKYMHIHDKVHKKTQDLNTKLLEELINTQQPPPNTKDEWGKAVWTWKT